MIAYGWRRANGWPKRRRPRPACERLWRAPLAWRYNPLFRERCIVCFLFMMGVPHGRLVAHSEYALQLISSSKLSRLLCRRKRRRAHASAGRWGCTNAETAAGSCNSIKRTCGKRWRRRSEVRRSRRLKRERNFSFFFSRCRSICPGHAPHVPSTDRDLDSMGRRPVNPSYPHTTAEAAERLRLLPVRHTALNPEQTSRKQQEKAVCTHLFCVRQFS
jgi:hypothetical protein